MGDFEAPQQQTLTVNIEEDADKTEKRPSQSIEIPLTHVKSPSSPGIPITPLPFQRPSSLDIDDYFTGPRDIQKHSKWPLFMRVHGSIIPKLLLPLFLVGCWATAIVVISKLVYDLGVDSVLLTITGFVVGLGLSFRSSTAYERYAEGRRFWASLIMASHCLGRVFWIHAKDAPNRSVRESTLRKVSAMNMVVAFAVSLKHQLRFEPLTHYPDLQHLVGHLNTFAKEATDLSPQAPAKKNFFKEIGLYLGVSFAESNPRKTIKKAEAPLGNLPLEILNHLALTVDSMITKEQLTIPMQQTLAYNNLAILNDCLNGCDRVLSTPLPIAYTIAISQITWVYVCLLPFQLIEKLDWIAIPATVFAAYIILGLLLIGQEIENPFGNDVNDLPLEVYCEQIAHDMDVIAAYDKTRADFMLSDNNMPLYPVSTAPIGTWMQRSEEKLREALRTKPQSTFNWRRTRYQNQGEKSADHMA
jgi:putative membrane protein